MTTISGFIDGILDGTIPPAKQNHYLEIEWNVYENGYMEEEPVSDVYPFKDEDNEIKTEIYKRVLQYLGMEYVSPNIRWMKFDDEGFDYFDN